MWGKKPPFFRNLGCKGTPLEYSEKNGLSCGRWRGEFQMSPVGAQLWVAASYHFVNDSSEKGTSCSAVSTQYACCYPVCKCTHLCSWEWCLESGLLSGCSNTSGDTPDDKVVMRVSVISGCLMTIPVSFDTADTYFKTSFPECLRPYCFKRMMIMFSWLYFKWFSKVIESGVDFWVCVCLKFLSNCNICEWNAL